jgi:tetratricopeptide (TPR) repeat protein
MISKREQALKTVIDALASLESTCRLRGLIGLLDLNRVAQHFFCRFLNEVYGLNLTELDQIQSNFPAIDLGDTNKRKCFQITSDKSGEKIQTTLDKFAEKRLYDNYGPITILVIGERQKEYKAIRIPTGIGFRPENDILGVSELVKHISTLDTLVLERLAEIVRTELNELISSGVPVDSITVNEVRSALGAFSTTMLPEALASAHQASLDVARDLLKANKPSQVIALLDRQKSMIWPNATGPIKARLLSTIAGAKLAIGADSEAAHLFLEAQQYNPNDEKAVTNTAIGYLLLGEHEKAAATARSVVDRNPAYFQAYSVLIQASTEPLDTIAGQLPQFCLTNCEVALALGFVARRRGDFKTAKHWLRIAATNDADNNLEIRGMLAETILHVLITNPASPVRIRQLDEESRRELEEAKALFDAACNASDDAALLRTRIAWFVNAVITSRMLGKMHDADEYLARAKRIAPDDPNVVYQSAVMSHDRGDLGTAIGLAQSLGTPTDIPNAPMFLANLLWEAHRHDEAIQVLLTFLEAPPLGDLARSARQLLVEMYMETKRPSEALTLIDDVLESDPSDVSSHVIASQLHRSLSQADAADASLEKARQNVTECTPSPHLFLLGNELGMLQRWSEASDVLERLVDTNSDSPLTRKYLNACYRASRLDRATAVCRNLRQRLGPLEFVTDMEVAILEETGDLSAARSLCEELVRARPGEGQRRVQLGVIYLRAHDSLALDALLDDPPDWQPLPIKCVQQLANLYSARKRYREAIKLLYELRRAHDGSGDIHIQYLQTFLFQDDDKHEWLDVQTVGPDVAVAIKDSSGETQWYIIEEREDTDIAKGELATTHRLAKELHGKSPGAKVVLKESSMSVEEGTIVAIKSKYLHAFHESGRVVEVRFPEQAGKFISLKVPDGPEGIRDLFRKLGEQQDEQQDRERKALTLYRENPIPIGAVGHLLDRNVMETWSHVTESEEWQLVSATGLTDEREQAATVLGREGVLFVVDPVSLLTIHALMVADEIVQAVGRLGIAQSTVDLITETIIKRTAINRRGFTTLTKERIGFVRQDVTREQVEANLLSLERLITWIGANCDVVAWNPALATKREERKELADVIGEESLDSILAAVHPARRLYSDDLRLRQLAKAEFGVEGIATQTILVRAREIGVIDRDRYCKAVVQLASAGYIRINVDRYVLLEAAKQADWAPVPPFVKTAISLAGDRSDEDDSVREAVEFLRLLWEQAMLPRSVGDLVLCLLDGIALGRNPVQVTDKVLAAVFDRFRLIPAALVNLRRIVIEWRALRHI